MATTVTHTWEVYNAAGTSVDFSISSIVGDTLPDLSSDPNGDGQEFDPLTGETRAGRYVGRVGDRITSGTDRVLTARLEDASFRQQLMRRKSIVKRTENGSTTVVLCAGLLTRLTLVGEGEYEYEVTDRTKIRSDVKIFAPKSGTVVLTAGTALAGTSLTCAALPIGLPKNTILNFGAGKIATVTATAAAAATSISVSALVKAVVSGDQATYRESVADFVARWPLRGCAFGGPITGGGFMDVPDMGGWLCQLQKNATGGQGPQLKFLQGYGPPDFGRWITDASNAAIAKATNDRVGPWVGRGGVDANGQPMLVTTAITTFDQAERSGFAKDLIVEVRPWIGFSAGLTYGYFQPNIFALRVGEDFPSLVDTGRPAGGGAPATDAGIWLTFMTAGQYAASGLPDYQSKVRARAFTANPSDISPIYIDLHPVTLVTTILGELGYDYDATSATTLIGVLGADLRYRDRITEPQAATEYLTQIQAAFGIGLRMADDGDLEFFATRIFENTIPAVEVTADDVVTPEEGNAGPVFGISEQSAIAKVVVEFNSITATPANASDRPPDGITLRPVRIERKNGDPGVVGDRTLTWTLSGMVSRVGSNQPDFNYFDVPIREVFDRFGRGVIECFLAFLRTGTAGDSAIGDEIVVTIPQLPNKNKRYGDDNTVGGRAMQVVALTKTIWGAIAKLLDSGPNAQPYATAPTISIAASADYPKTVAELTITNAATLNAAGAGLRVRMATSTGAAPASTDYADVMIFAAGQIPTGAFPLPSVIAGRKVYAKARTEIPLSNRPSSYSAASNVALSSYTAPSAVSVTADSSDGTKASATWTVGESTLRTRIYERETSGTTADDDILIEELQPGTNRYTLTHLKPGTGYTISVAHRDPVTGDMTAKATGTVTTDADVSLLPAPSNVRGFIGVQDASFGIETDNQSFGIAGRTDLPLIDVQAYHGIETAVASGVYGDDILLGRAAGRQGTWSVVASRTPYDGLRRRIRMRQLPRGRHPGLGSMMTAEVAALTLAEAASLDAFGLAGTFSEYVTVTPGTPTAIQKTTKTIRLGPHLFQPRTTATSFVRANNALGRAASGDIPAFFANVYLPVGSELTAWRIATGALASVNVSATLWRGGGVSGSTNLSTLSTAGAAGAPLATDTDSLAETMDGSDYAVEIGISGGGSTNNSEFLYAEIDYTSPALDVSL